MNRLKSFTPLIGLLFGSILLGIGVINLGGVILSAWWVPARGVVTRSAVESSGVRDRTTSPVIEYSYNFGGAGYAGNRIRFGLVTSPTSASELVDRYRVGDSVTVHVDPDEPRRSVLERRGLSVPVVETIAGFALLGVWLVAVRRERKPRSP